MLFFLKLQRDNRKNALAVDPAKGKTGKKLYFHRTMEMKQLHAITKPSEKGEIKAELRYKYNMICIIQHLCSKLCVSILALLYSYGSQDNFFVKGELLFGDYQLCLFGTHCSVRSLRP